MKKFEFHMRYIKEERIILEAESYEEAKQIVNDGLEMGDIDPEEFEKTTLKIKSHEIFDESEKRYTTLTTTNMCQV